MCRAARTRRVVGTVLVALLALRFWSVEEAVAQAAPCQFVHGFAELRGMLGPEIVGACLENQQPIPRGATQRTTQGLMVWAQVGNLAGFSDGTTVWLLGPYGLQRRSLDQYFDWEVAGGERPLFEMVGRQSTPVSGQPRPTPLPAGPLVDPALIPAWNALTVERTNIAGEHIGHAIQRTAEKFNVRFAVGPLRSGVVGSYRASSNTVTVNETALGEDPRALASILVHETTHASQVQYLGLGDARQDCVYMEVSAFRVEAMFWASFWAFDLPLTRTPLERHLNTVASILASEGEPGLYKLVVDTPGYQANCELWLP